MDALPDPSRPGATRSGFVLVFVRHTGLRAMELLRATVGDISLGGAGWRLYVVGKGKKPRFITLTAPAVRALNEPLEARGLDVLGVAGLSPDIGLIETVT